MLINLCLYCGPVDNGVGGARVLIDAIRHYQDEITQTGYAQNEGDGMATLSVLLSLSLSIVDRLLSETENLDSVDRPTGAVTDEGLAEFETIYFPAKQAAKDLFDTSTRAQTGVAGKTINLTTEAGQTPDNVQ